MYGWEIARTNPSLSTTILCIILVLILHWTRAFSNIHLSRPGLGNLLPDLFCAELQVVGYLGMSMRESIAVHLLGRSYSQVVGMSKPRGTS
ncbi:hypothetical protein B0H11DRAFT_1981018 [Mycena galericulata]|nr:hypothetical protein B0H11DRAFT_1981018 [Mycena galericulata]